MNLQHVADFIALVKDPAEFEKKLKMLQEEQDRLNMAIETIGKASKLDALRKTVEKRQVELEQEFEYKNKLIEDQLKMQLDNIEKANAILKEERQKVQEQLHLAEQKLEEAKKIQESFQGREKELRKLEEEAVRKQAKLDSQVTEYTIKLDKLKSVML